MSGWWEITNKRFRSPFEQTQVAAPRSIHNSAKICIVLLALRTVNNSYAQGDQALDTVFLVKDYYHRSIPYWARTLDFTTTQSETVNQLPHTSAWYGKPHCSCFIFSHAWFCNFTACTDRCRAPGLVLTVHLLCEITATTLASWQLLYFPGCVNYFCSSPTHGVVIQCCTVNFLHLVSALVSLTPVWVSNSSSSPLYVCF